MEELLKQLCTDSGFIAAFWERLRDYRAQGRSVSQREVFEELNGLYEEEIGEPRFPSFTAFRLKRDRMFRKSLENSQK